ncbi:LytTR family DNA-binding domain-containing protein [Roseivivax sp.]
MRRFLIQRLVFLDLAGRPFELSSGRLARVLLRPYGLLYLLLCYATLLATDPAALGTVFPAPVLPPLYFGVTLGYVLIFCALPAVLAMLPERLRPRVPTVAAGLVTATLMVLALEVLARTAGGPEASLISLRRMVGILMLVGFFDSVFFLFAYPAIARRGGLPPLEAPRAPARRAPAPATPEAEAAPPAPAAPTEDPEGRALVVGSTRVPIERVLLIEARQHHVQVTLEDRVLTQRARLADVVAQTRPEDGFQPHRSFWVPHRAAGALIHDGKRHVVRLTNDKEVPVARTRLPEVETWLARYKKIARSRG